MKQSYVPIVGDRVLVNSKGRADEGCEAYTDDWFPVEITKVNDIWNMFDYTHKNHYIMSGDNTRIKRAEALFL